MNEKRDVAPSSFEARQEGRAERWKSAHDGPKKADGSNEKAEVIAPLCRNTGAYADARVGGQLFSRDDFGYSRFVISVQRSTRPMLSKPFLST